MRRMNGDISLFTIDKLLNMLAKVDMEISIGFDSI